MLLDSYHDGWALVLRIISFSLLGVGGWGLGISDD